jgi:hypothetical protein
VLNRTGLQRLFGLSLNLFLLVASAASANQVETSGGQKIVVTGNTNTTFYAPTSTLSPDGSLFYLYVQGDENLSDPTYTDQILMYTHPNTWNGLTSQFTSPTRLLPDPTQGQNASCFGSPYCFYGHPSVFRDAGKYFMTALKSPDAVNFNEQLLGTSSNGSTWTWTTLFTTPAGINVPSVTLRYSSIGGQSYWWGFTELGVGGYVGIGAIRVHLSLHNETTGQVSIDYIEMISGGIWRSVPPGGQINFTPDIIDFGGVEPKLHWIYDHWELWASSVGEPKNNCGCITAGPYSYTAGFRYRTVTTGYSLGPVQKVYSQLRCLPASYSDSRAYPFRVEWTNLLYSMSNDQNCREDFVGAYIVVTAIQ